MVAAATRSHANPAAVRAAVRASRVKTLIFRWRKRSNLGGMARASRRIVKTTPICRPAISPRARGRAACSPGRASLGCASTGRIAREASRRRARSSSFRGRGLLATFTGIECWHCLGRAVRIAACHDADKPKASDRVSPQVNAPPRPAAPAAPSTAVMPTVSQAATLYEEKSRRAQQFQNFPGSVVWRTENVSVGPGRAPDLALRIEVEIPDRKMSVSLLLRRNMDASFPASHTLEIQFNSPGDPFGGISNVRGMRAKNAEAANGSVLILSEPEKIKEGDILFALPDTQLEQNIQLLRERPWFDIAFFYNNGRRGVLAFEKGTPGERAINDALAAWGQGG